MSGCFNVQFGTFILFLSLCTRLSFLLECIDVNAAYPQSEPNTRSLYVHTPMKQVKIAVLYENFASFFSVFAKLEYSGQKLFKNSLRRSKDSGV